MLDDAAKFKEFISGAKESSFDFVNLRAAIVNASDSSNFVHCPSVSIAVHLPVADAQFFCCRYPVDKGIVSIAVFLDECLELGDKLVNLGKLLFDFCETL